MLITFVRSIILYVIVLVVMRLMGKREIGQLQPFELAIAIMIADLASVPMSEVGIPIINGIIPILSLLVMHLIISFINLKSIKMRQLICGKPSILIYRGKINEKVLIKERFTINELQERLRANNINNLADVEYAILETSGQVSIIQKPNKRTTIPEDFNIMPEYEGISYDLVVDGKIMNDNLKILNKTYGWLKKEVNKLYCAELAQKGYIVFCVEYPLSPKAKIIDILNDLIIAINKINEIAIDYNGDNNDLYLTGDSAGAYLCVYLSALKNNSNLINLLKLKNKINPSIKGLGLISGMFYTNKFDQIGVFVHKLIYGKNYKKEYHNAYYNIENKEIISFLSPCFLITNKGDFLRHYSVNFSKKLAKYNIKYKLLNINSKKMLPHAFVAMLPETEEAKIANNEMIEFFTNIIK